jgi:uncharacterized protein YicC (UPF0701 family)
MAVWLPVLKAALPYVSNIVAAAIPAFTSRKGPDVSSDLVAQQITELQAAVTQNAEAVKTLAAQLEKTLTALQASESEMSERLTQQLRQQLGHLNESLARCESMANQTHAQATRLEGVSAALLMRVEELELQAKQQPSKPRRLDVLVAGIALTALLLAIVSVLR